MSTSCAAIVKDGGMRGMAASQAPDALMVPAELDPRVQLRGGQPANII